MLNAGARVAVVAPSGVPNPEGLVRGMGLIQEWGLVPVEAPNLMVRHRYTAGTCAQRQSDMRWALTDPNIDAVWFARGGYGTINVLSEMPWAEMDGRPIIGFSDATALFCAMVGRGVPGGIHGPVLHSLKDHADEQSREALRRLLLLGEVPFLPGRHLCGPTSPVRGPVVGGNLCVMASLVGTPWSGRLEGSILLLEDIRELPYKIDRMLTQLIQSELLRGVVGIGLGEFLGCERPSASYRLEDVLLELLSPLDIPVIADLPFGHGPRNVPWCVGQTGVLSEGGLGVA